MTEETTVQLVQRRLEAYNAHDVDAFLACYAPDAVFSTIDGDVVMDGREAIERHHRALFAGNPGLRASLLDRISVGDHVIDEELVAGRADGRTLHVAVVYRIADGLISGVHLIR